MNKIGLTDFDDGFPSFYLILLKYAETLAVSNYDELQKLKAFYDKHEFVELSERTISAHDIPNTAMEKYAGHFAAAFLWASKHFPRGDFPSMTELRQEGAEMVREGVGAGYVGKFIGMAGFPVDAILGKTCPASEEDEELVSQAHAAIAVKRRAADPESGIFALTKLLPNEPRWYAAQIMLLHEIFRREAGTPKDDDSEGANSYDVMVASIHKIIDQSKSGDPQPLKFAQIGYQIGFLYRDYWWRFNHEEAAVEAYRYREEQRRKSRQGAAATSAKKEARIIRFNRLAISTVRTWIARSEPRQIGYLKSIALADDEKTGDELFVHASKPLSDAWFRNALSELKATGELERELAR